MMSDSCNRSFKKNVREDIENQIELSSSSGLSRQTAICQILEVVADLVSTMYSGEHADTLRKEIEEEVRSSLISKLRS